MNKWLLIWNLVLTLLVFGLIFSGCESSSSQVAYLQSQIEANRAAIAQLQATVGQQTQLVQSEAAQLAALQGSINTSIGAVQAWVQQYVQEYVKAYVAK